MLMAIILAVAAVIGFIAGAVMFGPTGGVLAAIAFPVAGLLLTAVLVILLMGFAVASDLIGQMMDRLGRWIRERNSRNGTDRQ